MFNKPRGHRRAARGINARHSGRQSLQQFLSTGRQLTQHNREGIALDAGGSGPGRGLIIGTGVPIARAAPPGPGQIHKGYSNRVG